MHNLMTIPVAEQSEVWVYGRSLAGSNLARYMHVSLL